MTVITALAAATTEPHPGWGKLLGLVAALAIFLAGRGIHSRWRSIHETASSPDSALTALGGVKPQVKVGSDPTFDPTQKGSPEEAQKRPTVGAWIADRKATLGYRGALRAAAQKFGVSEATAKRRLREIDKEDGK